MAERARRLRGLNETFGTLPGTRPEALLQPPTRAGGRSGPIFIDEDSSDARHDVVLQGGGALDARPTRTRPRGRTRSRSGGRVHAMATSAGQTTGAGQAAGAAAPLQADARRPRPVAAAAGHVRGTWWRAAVRRFAAAVMWAFAVVASACTWSRPCASVDTLTAVLHRVERAEPAAPQPTAGATASEIDEEAALVALRTHRAPRTVASVASTCRSVEEFLSCNRGRVARLPADGTIWDRVLEAWIVARIDPADSRWTRPAKWQPSYDAPAVGKAASSWRAAMERLGYAPPRWPRSVDMARAMGADDDSVSQGAQGHAIPLFAWEVLDGLRRAPPTSTWERCAAALLVLGALGAARTGNTRRITLGRMTAVGEDVISVSCRERPKPARDRRVAAAGKHDHPVRLRHWAVRVYVIPWLEQLRRSGFHDTAFAFPSMVRPKGRIVRTANGRMWDDLWVEPLREWSDRAIGAALRRFVQNLGQRSFRCLRAGNNIELRRSPGVSDVTRRLLHGRSVKDLIGSETAYNEVLAEDFVAATSILGSVRFVRQPDGLLSATHTSASAGERDDWVPSAVVATFAAPPVGEADSTSEAEEDDGARVGFACFRCGTEVPRTHHGFLCDRAGCDQGTCVPCHPGGARAPLWCPTHDPRTRRKN
jgi:hypothetical protein